MTPDIDLIPGDYREWRWRRRALKFAGVATAACAIAIGFCSTVVAQKAADIEKRIAERRKAAVIEQQQQGLLDELNARIAQLEAEVVQAERLRSPGAIPTLFGLLHDAINDSSVWLDDLRLVRDRPDDRAADAGAAYIGSVLELDGQASSHAALSQLVKRLYDNESVSDVRLDRTSRRTDDNGGLIGFELSVVLRNPVRTRA